MPRRWIRALCGAAQLLCASTVVAAPLIELQAVLGTTAVLQVDGVRRTLRVGQSSPDGVRLVQLEVASAQVEVDGRRLSLKLGSRAGGVIPSTQTPTVRIARGEDGMYVTSGTVNGKPVEFLVDTGATTVAMNDATARRLGIDYRAGERRLVETASGVTESWFVTLREVAVGPIRVPNVEAGVIRGDQPSRALLGMSFLSRTRIEHEHDTLVLKRKY